MHADTSRCVRVGGRVYLGYMDIWAVYMNTSLNGGSC